VAASQHRGKVALESRYTVTNCYGSGMICDSSVRNWSDTVANLDLARAAPTAANVTVKAPRDYLNPFLRFLTDTFCQGPPTVREAIFLTTWTIQHVIDTNPGGVAPPIRIASLEKPDNQWAARELPEDEIAEHQQAIESAGEALRRWRDQLQSGEAAEGAPEPPPAPAGGA
jgi:hypothetical protein